MLDEMQAYVSNKLRLRVRSDFDEAKKACAAGGIENPRDVPGVPSLKRQSVAAIVV